MKTIGVFDSGIGGLSILSSLVEKLPYENFIYLSDNKIAMDKSQEEITNFSLKNSKKLIELNCKIIIVAVIQPQQIALIYCGKNSFTNNWN